MNHPKLSKTIKSILDKISLWTASLAGLSIIVMMIVMTADALGRKIFSNLPGAYETALAISAILMFSSQGYAQMRRAHLTVDILTQRLKPKTQTILRIIGALLGFVIFALLTWVGFRAAWKSTVVGEIWYGIVDYPVWPWRWFLPLGAGLLSAQFLRTAIDEFGKKCREK